MISFKKKEILAIIFDFDGVIVNSEPLWFKAATLSLDKLKYNYNKKITYKETIGMVSEKVWNLLLKQDLTSQQKIKLDNYYRKNLEVLFEKNLKLSRGIKNFLKRNNLPIRIVSNAPTKYIQKSLKKFKIDIFKKKQIISCSGILLPKPKPDGYLKAISDLELSRKNVLVIEDSDTGIAAAKAAKIKNIIRHTHNNENLPRFTKYEIPILKSFNDLYL